jgi:predicted RNase H-like HicB family nuclease
MPGRCRLRTRSLSRRQAKSLVLLGDPRQLEQPCRARIGRTRQTPPAIFDCRSCGSRVRVVSYNFGMQNEYKAVVREDGGWWIGWVEEIPGVNSQGASREELMENLQSALREMLAQNREEARNAAAGAFEEVRISA